MTTGPSRDRGRHVRGHDRPDHRGDAAGALSLPSGPAGLHPEKERETAPAGTAVLVGQARRRGNTPQMIIGVTRVYRKPTVAGVMADTLIGGAP